MRSPEEVDQELQRVSAELARLRTEASKVNTLIPTLKKDSRERLAATDRYAEISRSIKELRQRQAELQEGGEVTERHYIYTLRHWSTTELAYLLAPMAHAELILMLHERYSSPPFVIFATSVSDTDLRDFPERYYDLPWQ